MEKKEKGGKEGFMLYVLCLLKNIKTITVIVFIISYCSALVSFVRLNTKLLQNREVLGEAAKKSSPLNGRAIED